MKRLVAVSSSTGDAVGDVGEPIAGDVDHSPSGMAQPGIETEDAHRF